VCSFFICIVSCFQNRDYFYFFNILFSLLITGSVIRYLTARECITVTVQYYINGTPREVLYLLDRSPALGNKYSSVIKKKYPVCTSVNTAASICGTCSLGTGHLFTRCIKIYTLYFGSLLWHPQQLGSGSGSAWIRIRV
jgi:hypothetical protein